MYATAMAITADHHEACELTQEAFVRALGGMARLEDPDRFGSWVRGITYTLGQDLRRRAARERRHLQQVAEERKGVAPPADAGPAAQEAQDQRSAELAAAVSTLPESTRIALDLRFREGLSYAEIAEVMGVPASTVRGLLYRGTRALRLKLRPGLAPGGKSA
ncbi:MAG: sigma-70 family RNA polymerase sigma factor [Planctomycetes bacterium]|nr:sigma-70 family RNA polymerase sigma factor [Planctomycetota bacterium]